MRPEQQAGVCGDAHLPLERRHDAVDTDDIQHTRHVVAEHAERHLSRNLGQRLAQEVRRAHAHLQCAERMLDRLAPRAHGLGVLVEPLLHRLDHLLVLPAGDPPLWAFRACRLERTGSARICPIPAHVLAVFHGCHSIGELLPGRAAINILISQINKILLAETAFRFGTGCHRLRQRHGDAGVLARLDLLAVEVTAIGDGLEFLDLQRFFGRLRRIRELRAIRAHIRYLVRDDQMVLGVDRRLHIVADDAGAAPAGRHRAAVGIGERNLLIGRGQNLLLDSRQLRHFRSQLLEFLFVTHLLQRDDFRWILPVGGVELCQIACHALLQLLAPALDFRLREVLVAVIHCFELAAIDRDAGRREQSHLAAHLDEARADFFDRRPFVLAEIGDRLEVRRQPAQEPHNLDVAASLALEPSARMHAVEITVDVELHMDRGMISWAAGVGRIDAGEAKIAQIQHLDERIDHANRIAVVDPVIEAFRQQRRLPPICPRDKARHHVPADSAGES